MLRHLINHVLALLPTTRWWGLRRLLLRAAGIEVADDVKFSGRGWIHGRGRLAIGPGTWLSPGTVFYTHEQAPITIGARCDIGPGAIFMPGTHEMGDRSRRAGPGLGKPISVGDGCWIGGHSLILGGVSIAPGCMVAAGAVVARDLPPDSLAAGVPARVKRTLP